MIFGTWNHEEIWHEKLTHCLPRMPDVTTVPWELQKVILNSTIHTSFWLFTLSHKKTICNPLAHPTWKCHHTNSWIAKLFHLTEGLLRSFKRWRLRRESVVDCNRWLWKQPVVMWNVRQATTQQVFTVTTFCINTCFQSFSTLFSRIVNHVVLKFSPCRNKPLPQASTCPIVHINTVQYMRSSSSMPQTQY